MGFKDLVKAATAAHDRQGEYIEPNQKGRLEVQNYKVYKGRTGLYAILLAKVVSIDGKKGAAAVQKPGDLVKIFTTLYGSGKKVDAAYATIKTHLIQLLGLGKDDDVTEALEAVFGDHAEGISDEASAKAKAGLFFACKGILVDFDSYSVEDKEKKDASGKPLMYTRVTLANVGEDKGNSKEGIEKRKAAIEASEKAIG
jgi:hypothetical protein